MFPGNNEYLHIRYVTFSNIFLLSVSLYYIIYYYYFIFTLHMLSIVSNIWLRNSAKRDNILRRHFSWFGGLIPTSRPFLIYLPTVINQKSITMCSWIFTILKVCTEAIKNSKHHLLKKYSSHYIGISSN